MTGAEVDAIREELSRRAGGAQPQPAHYVVGKDDDFCEPCAATEAGDADVCRETNSDSDVLRWCASCGALLDYRVGPEGAAEELSHFETIPPTTEAHWAELLHAMTEVPPEDWRKPSDGPVEPSPLWERAGALVRGSGKPTSANGGDAVDEEIELTTMDGQTVRVALSGAVRACGAAIQGSAYSVAGRDGERVEVRRVREGDVVPPEIEEDAAAVAVAVDAAVTRVLDRRDVAERAEKRRLLLEQFDRENPDYIGERCHASRGDGECNWDRCPQDRDGEPHRSGRHCPLDRCDDEEA